MGTSSGLKNIAAKSSILSGIAALCAGVERLGQRLETRLPRIPATWRGPGPLIGFFIALILLISRGYRLLDRPDFYIEDGREFFQNAHNLGLSSLWRVYAGYLHLFPRLAALYADCFPLKNAPSLLMAVAINLQAATAAFLLSKRLSNQIPSYFVRAMAALLVIGYANSDELYGNVAHSQWYLAILAVALICAEPSENRGQRILEVLVIFVAAFTGPFAPVLALVAGFRAWKDRRFVPYVAILGLGSAVAIGAMLTHPRLGAHQGHRPPLLFRMVSNQVAIGATQGYAALRGQEFDPFFVQSQFFATLMVAGLVFYAFRKGGLLVRALVLLGAFSLGTVLISEAQWKILGSPGVGERYFLYLGLSFLAGAWLLAKFGPRATFRWLGRGILALAAFGVVANWIYPAPFTRFDYARQVAAYPTLLHGQTLDVKTSIDRRSKASWTMTLIKK